MTPLEILQGARELLTPPGNWTTGHLAKDAEGREVFYGDESAVCYCSAGALWKNGYINSADLEDAFVLLEETLPDGNITVWNDSSTHVEVLKGFDAAIALAKKETV